MGQKLALKIEKVDGARDFALWYRAARPLPRGGATTPAAPFGFGGETLDGPAGKHLVDLAGVAVTTARFDATLNPSRFTVRGSPTNRFPAFLAPGNLAERAAA